ncbi:MAG TPA: hypothetical protein VM409_05545 [Chloroflexia bacterium]|nr:hypothetical protein [Chloroflexia bacterium]
MPVSLARGLNYLWLILLGLLLAALLARAAISAATSAQMFTYPFQFDESEGMIVAETMLLDRGVNIYARPGPELFVAAPYPPLFYLLAWPLQHVAGAEPTFKIGRAFSIIATLVSGIAIYGITVGLTKDRVAGALGAALWWSLGLVTFWGSLVKPDVLAVAFGLCGIWVAVTRPQSQVWLSLPLFLAAFYTKQTAVAAAAATMGWLFVAQPRRGLLFGLSYALGVAVPSVILDLMTGGGYFYHMFTVHDLPWFGERFQQYALNFIGSYGYFLVPGMLLALVAGIAGVVGRFRRSSLLLPGNAGILLLLYLLLSMLSSIGAGTLGGNHNHLLDWAAAACLGSGVLIAVLRCSSRLAVQVTGLVFVLVLLSQVPALYTVPAWLKKEYGLLDAARTEGLVNIFQYVTNNGGTAYSDNVGLMLATRKKLWTTDPFTQTHATLYGRWDETKLVRAITEGQFDQIVIRIDVFDPRENAGDVSPTILQAVRNRYKLDQRNVENIYVPK